MVKAESDIVGDQGLNIYEPELLEPTLLCDGKGNLDPSSIGWSRQPIYNCSLSGHWPRKKKWNYWNITSQKYLFCAAVMDFDYAAFAFTYLYNFDTNIIVEKKLVAPFGKGCEVADNVTENVHIKSKEMSISFKEDKGFTKIYVECLSFKDELPLKAEFIIEHPSNLETLNVVIPWNKKRFQFTSKQNCLPAIGTAAIGSEVFYFKAGEAFASLDFGRGIWPRKIFWNWATASGIYRGKSIGLNMGGGWTDGTGMTENAVLFDGRINKVSDNIGFNYNHDDIMKPWRIKTKSSSRVDLEFSPRYDRSADTNIILVKSNMHQVFGHFTGQVVLDSGETAVIENIPGCVEEHYAIW